MEHYEDTNELIKSLSSVNDDMNELYKQINIKLKLKYDLILYNLLKEGVGVKQIADAGYGARSTVYDMVERINNLIKEHNANNNH